MKRFSWLLALGLMIASTGCTKGGPTVDRVQPNLIDKAIYANFTPYVGAALIFLAVTIPATRYADYLMNKQARARS